MSSNPQETADLVKFTEEILNEKFDFLCSGSSKVQKVTIYMSPCSMLIDNPNTLSKFFKHRSSFQVVFYKNSCSAKRCDTM